MSVYTIEPRDPLVVRDGRPNNGRSESSTLAFPYPSTIAGAVRTRIGANEAGTFDEFSDAELSVLRKTRVYGPLLAQVDEPAMLYVPQPRDAAVHADRLRRLAPMELGAGALVDDEMKGMMPVGLPPRPDSGENDERPAKKQPTRLAFWPWSLFERWLAAPSEFEQRSAKEELSACLKPLEQEARVHVKVGDTWTAEESMLFETAGRRFTTDDRRKLALAFDVGPSTLEGRALREGIGPFAGERRLVDWKRAESLAWPALPDGVRRALLAEDTQAVLIRVILLTPALFMNGHKPGDGSGQLLAPRTGVSPRLVAACVPRPETISGWDFKKRAPKATRRLVPAGSVYWLELAGRPEARVEWAHDVMMSTISDAEQDRLDGFGLAAIGVGR